MLRNKITTNIKNYRKHLRLTQAGLAEKVNQVIGTTWSQTTVYMIESNKRSLDIDELEGLAKALEVTVEDLMRKEYSDEEFELAEHQRKLISAFKVAREAMDAYEAVRAEIPNPESLPVAYAENAKEALEDYRHWYKVATFDEGGERVTRLEYSNP